MLALRRRLLWRVASAALVLLVIWGSLQTQVDIPAPEGVDKFEHFGCYAFLTVWFTGLYARSRYWVVAVALLALGLSMEIGQYLMGAGRDADPYDMAANTVGVALGLASALTFTGGWAPKVETWLGRS